MNKSLWVAAANEANNYSMQQNRGKACVPTANPNQARKATSTATDYARRYSCTATTSAGDEQHDPKPRNQRSGEDRIRTPHENPENTADSIVDGAKSGSLAARNKNTDNDLSQLVAAWPFLPKPIRAGILAMIRAAGCVGE